MTTLTREALNKELAADGGLRVTPLLDSGQVGPSSIDVRLGNQFIVFRRHLLGSFDPNNPLHSANRIQQRRVVRWGQSLTLHPGMLVLGSTFEFVRMPGHLEAQVEGRSSWARVGLMVATATHVEPRFGGAVTLELTNMGTTPLQLQPGVRIAQLIVRTAQPVYSSDPDAKKYGGAIGPMFSRLSKDKELALLRELGTHVRGAQTLESP